MTQSQYIYVGCACCVIHVFFFFFLVLFSFSCNNWIVNLWNNLFSYPKYSDSHETVPNGAMWPISIQDFFKGNCFIFKRRS